MSFESYTDSLLRAFNSHQRQGDVIKRKKEILDGVAAFYNFTPDAILFVGFSPAILTCQSKNIYVTSVSQDAKLFLDKSNIKYTFIESTELKKYNKFFDVVVALDEYFTFAQNDEEQKIKVAGICRLAKEYIITTCKDYKNQEFKDREFSLPALIRGKENLVYLEFHDHDLSNRNKWLTRVFELGEAELAQNGPYHRCAMFFKQLAKFSTDAGATGFSVHKNLMYKSLIKKNYEHVISIQFDNNGS